jgi:hypothetical protein
MGTYGNMHETGPVPHLHLSPPKKWIPVNLPELWKRKFQKDSEGC